MERNWKSLKELEVIEKARDKARQRVVEEKPPLMHIEHVDRLANIRRKKLLTAPPSPLSDDGKNAKLKEFGG